MPRLTMFQPGAAAGGQAQTCSAATVPLLQAALCPPHTLHDPAIYCSQAEAQSIYKFQLAMCSLGTWAISQMDFYMGLAHINNTFSLTPNYIILLILKWKKWAKAKKFDGKRQLLLFLPVLGRQRAENTPSPSCFFFFFFFQLKQMEFWLHTVGVISIEKQRSFPRARQDLHSLLKLTWFLS